jgi:hypothetical protein
MYRFALTVTDNEDGYSSASVFVESRVTGIDEVSDKNVPEQYVLDPVYPNPFNPVTSIRYHIPKAGNVTLVVYNARGQRIATLLNESKNAGIYITNWDASNMASGTYFIKMQANEFVQVRKCVLLR